MTDKLEKQKYANKIPVNQIGTPSEVDQYQPQCSVYSEDEAKTNTQKTSREKKQISNTDKSFTEAYYARALRDAMKLQPKVIQGFFQNIRDITILSATLSFVILPWINWDAHQAFWIDFDQRQFHFFNITFFPQDVIYLSWIFLIAALALFFFTVLYGRVFCGYICPQSSWTRLFFWVEHKIEGDRNQRIKFDLAPWSAEKILRRLSKHSIWLLIAFITAFTFVGYFSPIREMAKDLLLFNLSRSELWVIVFFTTATYINAGWMREKVCKYICPYARFQSVMFDKNTYTVSYDMNRGEPRSRGARRKVEKIKNSDSYVSMPAGDCIDCGLCVQVCPTGIDIRDGLQYECIACAACIDVCDHVMEKIDKPKGLIRYTTENELHGKKTQFWRTRMISYGALLAVMCVILAASLITRKSVMFDVLMSETTRSNKGLIAENGNPFNHYQLKLSNLQNRPAQYAITIEAPEDIFFIGKSKIELPPSSTIKIDVELQSQITGGHDIAIRSVPITFVLTSLNGEQETTTYKQTSRFLVLPPAL